VSALDTAALGRLAERLLTQRTGDVSDAASVSAAARRSFDELVRVLAPLIGPVGIDALASRAVHLARAKYPWLAKAGHSEQADGLFADVSVSLQRQEPALATEGAAAVLAAFTGLLVAMIGEPLTARVMRQAWPDGFSDAGH
jgi:hypothetical protein